MRDLLAGVCSSCLSVKDLPKTEDFGHLHSRNACGIPILSFHKQPLFPLYFGWRSGGTEINKVTMIKRKGKRDIEELFALH